MGARCVDGVVLVADKKVTYMSNGEISGFDFQNKLFDGLGHIIYGSAGRTGMYRLFVDTVEEYVRNQPNEMNFKNAVLKLSEIAYDIYRRYNFHPDYYFELLVAVSPDPGDSHLTYITGDGMIDPKDTCWSIGSGKKYASILLKNCYRRNMNMEQAAELGYFAIKYIEDFQLEMTVGIGDGTPQIWFVPDEERYPNNVKKDYQITADNAETQQRLTRIRDNVNRRLEEHRNHIDQLFRPL